MNDVIDQNGRSEGPRAMGPLAVYVLYLAGYFLGVTPLIGLITAYVLKGGGPNWAESHYRFQIRTFWIGFFGGIALMALMAGLCAYYGAGLVEASEDKGVWVGASGFAGLIIGAIATGLWTFLRSLRGLILALRQEPVPNPGSLFLG